MTIFNITLTAQELIKLGLLLIINIFLSGFLLFLSIKLSTNNPDSEKLSAYECGFEPYEDARNIFDVRFYLIAILFLIFDLESVYFFPWCITFNTLNIEGYFFMLEFLIELFIGYIYAWLVGALDWN